MQLYSGVSDLASEPTRPVYLTAASVDAPDSVLRSFQVWRTAYLGQVSYRLHPGYAGASRRLTMRLFVLLSVTALVLSQTEAQLNLQQATKGKKGELLSGKGRRLQQTILQPDPSVALPGFSGSTFQQIGSDTWSWVRSYPHICYLMTHQHQPECSPVCWSTRPGRT